MSRSEDATQPLPPVHMRIYSRDLPSKLQPRVRQSLHLVTETDGVNPLSEQAILALARHEPNVRHFVIETVDDGSTPPTLVGYGQLTASSAAPPSAELFVHPDFRQAGLGTQIITSMRREMQQHSPLGKQPLAIWAHDNLAPAQSFARQHRCTRTRDLYLMLRPEAAGRINTPPLPEGVTIRPVQPGVDDEAILSLNNSAFVTHPEQGQWTMQDIADRFRASWFNPAGLLLAFDTASGELLGFHWTKRHEQAPRDIAGSTPARPPVGEVYVMAVSPQAQGRGIGKALLLAGIAHLHESALPHTILYVDATNEAAVGLYQKYGFQIWHNDVQYACSVD